jgi:hypothetical protein
MRFYSKKGKSEILIKNNVYSHKSKESVIENRRLGLGLGLT